MSPKVKVKPLTPFVSRSLLRRQELALKHLYYKDTKGSGFLSGQAALLRAAKVRYPELKFQLKDIRAWLAQQKVWALHKRPRWRRPELKNVCISVDHTWHSDLIEMREQAPNNDGHYYILTAIDCTSRYAFAEPLLDKRAESTIQAFTNIFNREKRRPNKIVTDAGSEFIAKSMQTFLAQHNIQHFVTQPGHGASLAERFNQSLKNSIYRYFTVQKNSRWIDILQSIVTGYNSRLHRGINMVPKDVTYKDQGLLFKRAQIPAVNVKLPKPAFKVGDKVHVLKDNTVFKKGYLRTVSDEVLIVARVLPGRVWTYRLTDLKGKKIIWQKRSRVFYKEDLVLAVTPS